MRSYIFTDRERGILKTWLEKKERLEGFNRLAFNTRKDIVTLIEDMELVLSAIAVNFPDVDFAATKCSDMKQVVIEWQKLAYSFDMLP
ncbi:hypothetical protein ACFL0D_02130 [Thermoproteota archaeon]